MQINGNTRLIDMTLEELFQAIDERIAEREKSAKKAMPEVVYGLTGIMQVYQCSKSTAARILRSGRIDAAVSRVSARKLVINVAKALSLCPNL